MKSTSCIVLLATLIACSGPSTPPEDTDGVADTDTDVGSDTPHDSDTEPDDSDSDTVFESDTDIPIDSDTITDSDESDTPTESDTDGPIDSDTDTDTPADSDSDTPADSDTDAPIDTDTPADSDSDLPIESGIDHDTGGPGDTDPPLEHTGDASTPDDTHDSAPHDTYDSAPDDSADSADTDDTDLPVDETGHCPAGYISVYVQRIEPGETCRRAGEYVTVCRTGWEQYADPDAHQCYDLFVPVLHADGTCLIRFLECDDPFEFTRDPDYSTDCSLNPLCCPPVAIDDHVPPCPADTAIP